jgi:hypothetical protein
MAPPLSSLSSDFPMRPKLLGNLIPATYNLWIGGTPASGAPSCSGGIWSFHDLLCLDMFACLIIGLTLHSLVLFLDGSCQDVIRHVPFDLSARVALCMLTCSLVWCTRRVQGYTTTTTTTCMC